MESGLGGSGDREVRMSQAEMRPGHVPADLVRDVDVYDLPGDHADIHEAWLGLRPADGPGLIWTPRNGGHWIVTRGALVAKFFADTDHLSAKELSVPPGQLPYPMIPNQSDEPEHRDYREIIMPFLRPRTVWALQEKVRALAVELIEQLYPAGECEFLRQFAKHLPMQIFLGLVDLPDSDREWLIERTEVMVRSNDGERRRAALAEVRAYLEGWIARRGAEPGDDMLSAIVHGKVGGRPMSELEILGECSDVLFGGLDTVAAMMSFITHFLATHPEHRHQLAADPSLIPAALEELLRRHGIAAVARRVIKDLDCEGAVLRAGDMVLIPSACHGLDDREWDDPLTVDFSRARNRPHATFGVGVHTCPGAGLARSELTIFLEEWLKRIPDFRLKPGFAPEGITGGVTALKALELEWDPT